MHCFYWCSPYCTYTYKLAERSGVESREQHEGGKWAQGNASEPASQPRETARRPQQETEDYDLSRIILQYVLLAFLLPHFLRELYFLAGVGAECMEGLAHKRRTSLQHGDKPLRTNSPAVVTSRSIYHL